MALPTLLSPQAFPTHEYKTPEQVASQASVVEARYGYIISASGGVEIDSWAEVARSETTDTLSPVLADADQTRGSRWWW